MSASNSATGLFPPTVSHARGKKTKSVTFASMAASHVLDHDDDDDHVNAEEGRRPGFLPPGLRMTEASSSTTIWRQASSPRDEEQASSSSSSIHLLDYGVDPAVRRSSSSSGSMVQAMAKHYETLSTKNSEASSIATPSSSHGETPSSQGEASSTSIDYAYDLDISSLGEHSVNEVFDHMMPPPNHAMMARYDSQEVGTNGWLSHEMMGLSDPALTYAAELRRLAPPPSPPPPVDKVFEGRASSPNDKTDATHDDDSWSFDSSARLFGIKIAKVIAGSAFLVILALVLVIVAAVVLNDSDSSSSPSDTGPYRDPISQWPATESTNAPSPDSTRTTSTISTPEPCFPDNDTATFYIDDGLYTCPVFRQLTESVRERLCQLDPEIYAACRSSCGNCSNEETPPPPTSVDSTPTMAPTNTVAVTPSSPTSAPTTFLATSAPTVEHTCPPDHPDVVPTTSYTCRWLSQSNEPFRLRECAEGEPAREHCPTTCEAC